MGKEYFYVYIVASDNSKVLYTGVTSDLIKRIYEHKNKLCKGFTSKYNVNRLVYYEVFEDGIEAIEREKQIKGGNRKKKEVLITTFNKNWKDLYNEVQ
jgi:putative endonuclease